jgi:hypothetical protein
MTRSLRIAAAFVCLASPLTAQSRPSLFSSAPRPTREIGAVFIGMASCCESLTESLREPIDSVRHVLQRRALREGADFRMIGVSLDWRPEDGWNYLKHFGEFDEIGLGNNWFSTLPEVLMFTDGKVDPVVPQLVIYERTVDFGGTRPKFGPRTIVSRLEGRPAIMAWLQGDGRSN